VGVRLLGVRCVVEEARAGGLGKHAKNLERGRANNGNERRGTNFLAGTANRSSA
jgi:hypothetical protein